MEGNLRLGMAVPGDGGSVPIKQFQIYLRSDLSIAQFSFRSVADVGSFVSSFDLILLDFSFVAEAPY